MTESLLAAGGEVGGGDRGLEDADVATAKATAAVDVLLLHNTKKAKEIIPDVLRKISSI